MAWRSRRKEAQALRRWLSAGFPGVTDTNIRRLGSAVLGADERVAAFVGLSADLAIGNYRDGK